MLSGLSLKAKLLRSVEWWRLGSKRHLCVVWKSKRGWNASVRTVNFGSEEQLWDHSNLLRGGLGVRDSLACDGAEKSNRWDAEWSYKRLVLHRALNCVRGRCVEGVEDALRCLGEWARVMTYGY